MTTSLHNSVNNSVNKSIEILNDAISTTSDSTSECCIIEEEESVENEVKKLLNEILHNKIFDEVILPSQDEIRKLLWTQFKLCGLNAKEAARSINKKIGTNIVTDRRAVNLFRIFRDEQTKTNNNLLMKKFEENPAISAEDLSKGVCSIMFARRWLWKKSRERSTTSTTTTKNSVNSNSRENSKELSVSKPSRPTTRKRKTSDKFSSKACNVDENGKEEDTDGQQSICQIDPVTKKRFYEPHKRPGCDDVYCLSSVTQIGERICNIENKMIQLEELFFELTKRNTSSNLISNNYIANHQFQQPSSSQQYNREHHNRYLAPTNNFNGPVISNAIRGVLPIQKSNEQIYRPNNPIQTQSQVQQRIIAPRPSLSLHRFPVRQMLPAASATATISTTRPLSGYPINRPLRIIHSQQNDNNLSKPVEIPHKELRNGVRVYFVNITNSSQNTCPVCFGVFSGMIFTDRTGSILKNIHLKRHISGPLEAFYCQICSHFVTQPRILFLSLPSIVQHLINSHGMSTSAQFSNFCIKNYNNAETIEALQHFMANQLRISITQLITEINSSKDNLNWAKSASVSQNILTKTVIGKNAKKSDNSIPTSQNKKKRKRGREETPIFNLDGDPLDHLLKCPKECTLIQRHRMLKGRMQPKQLIESINIKNIVIDQSLLGLAKYVEYKNEYKQTKHINNKQPNKVIHLDEDSEHTDTNANDIEEIEDDDLSSNDSDYSPKKSNKGWIKSKNRKKLGTSERSTFNNVVEQLQQHRQQQQMTQTSSSFHSMSEQKPLVNITLTKSQSSNGVLTCKTEPDNQKH